MARVTITFPSGGDLEENLDKVHSQLHGFRKEKAERKPDGSVEATMQGSVFYIRNAILSVLPDAIVEGVPGREEENVLPDPNGADEEELVVEEDPR